MPELPEVQTIVDDLNKKILKRRITRVWCDSPSLIKGAGLEKFRSAMSGAIIRKIERRGKNIFIHLGAHKKDLLLVVHLKMTGHFLVGKWKLINGSWKSAAKGFHSEKVNGYIHLMFYLDDGRMLALSDVRKFARVLLGKPEEIRAHPHIKNLGPEPLDRSFTEKKFEALLKSRSGRIKQALMDQKVIAGVGNIYSDEILWRAKISPLRRADSLGHKESAAIFGGMRSVLARAVRLRGSSINNYRDTFGRKGGYGEARLVYGREGEKCFRCGAIIRRIKIGGRSASFCPKCQK